MSEPTTVVKPVSVTYDQIPMLVPPFTDQFGTLEDKILASELLRLTKELRVFAQAVVSVHRPGEVPRVWGRLQRHRRERRKSNNSRQPFKGRRMDTEELRKILHKEANGFVETLKRGFI